MKFILPVIFLASSIFSESTNTTLSEAKQIDIFSEVTSKIRCICLPSLPIKSCSFNNCPVSAMLKQFIENRIRAGETSNEIIAKLQTGYGDSVSTDPIVKKFISIGSDSMANGIIHGFGERILAEPDSTWINITLILLMISGISLIGFFYRLNSKKISTETKTLHSENLKKYLKEIEG